MVITKGERTKHSINFPVPVAYQIMQPGNQRCENFRFCILGRKRRRTWYPKILKEMKRSPRVAEWIDYRNTNTQIFVTGLNLNYFGLPSLFLPPSTPSRLPPNPLDCIQPDWAH